MDTSIGQRVAGTTFEIGFFLMGLSGCLNMAVPTYNGPRRSFTSSFETDSDFSPFYLETGPAFASQQGLSDDRAVDGVRSHKSWITAARDTHNDGPVYQPHRAYPTVQFCHVYA